mmetsp:Transcript_34613/g.91329  ORF Transcript_34613/g.91329 Transcript_34613/m.91329 type:complete len:159 (-) Transcript_34613:125-601(-)
MSYRILLVHCIHHREWSRTIDHFCPNELVKTVKWMGRLMLKIVAVAVLSSIAVAFFGTRISRLWNIGFDNLCMHGINEALAGNNFASGMNLQTRIRTLSLAESQSSMFQFQSSELSLNVSAGLALLWLLVIDGRNTHFVISSWFLVALLPLVNAGESS